jgi:RNA polymerase sigma-70 factor (ECF subfamily)
MAALVQESNLLRQLVLGDAAAFRAVYEKYSRKVFAFAFYLTKSRDVAEEMVQEVFLKVWEKREQIDPERDFNPYVKTITQNQVYNFLNKARRDRNLQEKIYAGMQALQHQDEDVVIERELGRLYAEAVRNLPPQKRIIYSLHRNDGYSYEEIARKLGLSKNTVRNHLQEASKSVQRYVSGHSDLAIIIIAICMMKEKL